MRLEAPVPDAVLAAIRAPFLAAGGLMVETPISEPLGVYLDLAGEGLRERLFIVSGAEENCLRPDFTVGIAKLHIASGKTSGRYVYDGPAFRVAPPGVARSEQFRQVGLEAFERGDIAETDAEAALLGWRAACAGGRDDLRLMLGDVALFGSFLAAIDVDRSTAGRLIAALSRPARLERELAGGMAPRASSLAELLVGIEEARAVAVLEEIWALAGIEPVGGRSAAEVVHRLTTRAAEASAPSLSAEARGLIGRYLAIEDQPAKALESIAGMAANEALNFELAVWERRLTALSEVPADRVTFAAGFHRPFGYYDGMLFEVRSAALGEEQAVAAGGRYDGLPARLGASLSTGAVGCMVRPGRAWKGARV